MFVACSLACLWRSGIAHLQNWAQSTREQPRGSTASSNVYSLSLWFQDLWVKRELKGWEKELHEVLMSTSTKLLSAVKENHVEGCQNWVQTHRNPAVELTWLCYCLNQKRAVCNADYGCLSSREMVLITESKEERTGGRPTGSGNTFTETGTNTVKATQIFCAIEFKVWLKNNQCVYKGVTELVGERYWVKYFVRFMEEDFLVWAPCLYSKQEM